MHAWCANAAPGAVALSFTNVRAADTVLTLPTELAGRQREEYVLTAAPGGGGNLSGDVAFLNGTPLQARADGTLDVYPLPGRACTPQTPLTLPPFSLGFVVFTHAHAHACEG